MMKSKQHERNMVGKRFLLFLEEVVVMLYEKGDIKYEY